MTRDPDHAHARAAGRAPDRALDRGAVRPRGALLVAAVVGAVLIGGGAAFATYRLVVDDPGAASTPAPPPSGSSTPRAPAPSPPPASSAPQTRGSASWQEAAAAYGEAFTNSTGGKQAWLGRLEDLVAPSLAQGYAFTDLAVVPREDFVAASGGEPVAGETPSRAMRLEYTSGLLVDITVSQVPTTRRWVVTTAVPAEPVSADPVQADQVGEEA